MIDIREFNVLFKVYLCIIKLFNKMSSFSFLDILKLSKIPS